MQADVPLKHPAVNSKPHTRSWPPFLPRTTVPTVLYGTLRNIISHHPRQLLCAAVLAAKLLHCLSPLETQLGTSALLSPGAFYPRFQATL